LSYNNHIVGFFQNPEAFGGFSIIMSNGNNSTSEQNNGSLEIGLIPTDSVIRKVIMGSDRYAVMNDF
jgi:hypothetical protein